MNITIRPMTEKDFAEIKQQAEFEQTNTLRPNKDGSWKSYVFSEPYYGSLSLGNGTQYKVGLFYTKRGELFLAIEGRGAYTFRGWVHWGYASEKLGLRFEGDARNISDFLNAQLGHENPNGELQGEYQERFCE